MNENKTYFSTIYSDFLSKVTDEMYAETWTEADLKRDLESILMSAIPNFSFPKFPLYDFKRSTEDENGDMVEGYFNSVLSLDEIVILSNLMMTEWLTRQIMTTENIRQKVYSSSDFKVSSQANHLDKLKKLRDAYVAENKANQKMYGRREITVEGRVKTTLSKLAGEPK